MSEDNSIETFKSVRAQSGNRQYLERFYPESRVGGFSFSDASVAFFSQINAVLRSTDTVLDFGAGRGAHIVDETVDYRRRLSILRGKCAHVEGCDVDDAVLRNPFLDHAEVIGSVESLPYSDNSFDMVISRFVFEHVSDPDRVAGELLRVVKPGGVVAALTPNKFGYIALASSIVPNRLHVRALRRVQPERKAVDVFPTMYQLNTRRDLETAFGTDARVSISYFASEPAYFFGSSAVYRVTKWMHKYLPDRLRPLLIVYVHKAAKD